jgi:DNA-binding NarL/FixJ family response regulator
LSLEVDQQPAPTGPVDAGKALGLSERELEVLQLIAAGKTNRQIATELFITEKTAAHHVSSILGKLGAATRVEAAAIAYRTGLSDAKRARS